MSYYVVNRALTHSTTATQSEQTIALVNSLIVFMSINWIKDTCHC